MRNHCLRSQIQVCPQADVPQMGLQFCKQVLKVCFSHLNQFELGFFHLHPGFQTKEKLIYLKIAMIFLVLFCSLISLSFLIFFLSPQIFQVDKHWGVLEGYWRRLLRFPWTSMRSNHSILKEINPEYSLEGLMLKLKFQYFGHLM